MLNKRAHPGKEYVQLRSCRRKFSDIGQWPPISYKVFCSNYGEHCTDGKGPHCWNDEAIQGMKDDLSAIWDSFVVDLIADIQYVSTASLQTYTEVGEIASSTAENGSPSSNDIAVVMRTFASNMQHREELIRCGIYKAMESFVSDLRSLRADTLTGARTAFVGKLMEATYHAANMEHGKSAFSSN
jgi:hypothetical protein